MFPHIGHVSLSPLSVSLTITLRRFCLERWLAYLCVCAVYDPNKIKCNQDLKRTAANTQECVYVEVIDELNDPKSIVICNLDI